MGAEEERASGDTYCNVCGGFFGSHRSLYGQKCPREIDALYRAYEGYPEGNKNA